MEKKPWWGNQQELKKWSPKSLCPNKTTDPSLVKLNSIQARFPFPAKKPEKAVFYWNNGL